MVVPPSSSVTFFSSNITNCDEAAPPPPPLLPGSENAKKASESLPIDKASIDLEEEDSIAQAAAMASAYRNPGPYEQASGDAKRLVMLDCHDGFRCDINKQLSPYMAVVHSFWLGTSMLQDRNKTYTWLTQVADESSLYMARVDPERQSVDGRIHKTLLGGLALVKLQLGLSPEGQNDQCMAEIDLSGGTWTANLKYGSAIGGLLYGCNFYQAITPNFSMGGEGMYVAANQNLASNYLLKYTMPAPAEEEDDEAFSTNKTKNSNGEQPSSTIIASLNTTGALTLNYKRVITPYRVTLGAELNCNPMTAESAVILGAEFKWTRSKLQVTLDGNAKMQSLLETKLGKEPGQPSLHFSADVDHLKDEMRFGYGLSIDG
jgi:mitochondrial import receptor subunit TOM40